MLQQIRQQITNNLNLNDMVTIKILKNGQLFKQFTSTVKMQQKYFELAIDIVGGMYNGKDEFKVVID